MRPRIEGRPTEFSSVLLTSNGELGNSAGGQIIATTAGAALVIGDVVFWSAANTVNKSSTRTNYIRFAGVVVGGDLTDQRAVWSEGDLGTPAAAANQRVLVQVTGIANVIADDTFTAPVPAVAGDATAGRVSDDAATGNVLGTLITSAASIGAAAKLFISPKSVAV